MLEHPPTLPCEANVGQKLMGKQERKRARSSKDQGSKEEGKK